MTPTLVCLPPAGAGPNLFRPWRQTDAHLLAPSLPGREARFSEPPAPSLPALADRLAVEIAPQVPRRYGLFGYSMGATLACLLTDRLMRIGHPPPEVLFVLGGQPPHLLHLDLPDFSAMSSAAFWDEIARIGGTPQDVLEHAELRHLLEPMLRHDFAMCQAVRIDPAAVQMPCPIHVFRGRTDHLVSAEDARAWRALGPTVEHDLPGGHMLAHAEFAALLPRLRSLWPDAAVTSDPLAGSHRA